MRTLNYIVNKYNLRTRIVKGRKCVYAVKKRSI